MEEGRRESKMKLERNTRKTKYGSGEKKERKRNGTRGMHELCD